MVPLGIMLLVAVYIFVERSIAVRNAARIDQNFMNIVRDHIISGNVSAARSFAKNTNNPVARIIDKGIQRIGTFACGLLVRSYRAGCGDAISPKHCGFRTAIALGDDVAETADSWCVAIANSRNTNWSNPNRQLFLN